MEAIVLIVVGAGTVIILAIFTPLLFAIGGYFTGWILADVFTFAGHWIVSGAQALGLNISLEMLPVIGALLAFVGAFFKSTQTNNNKSK